MYSVSASTGQNPLSSASYNAFGATALTFGSGDSDSFTYDPNTGRQIFLGIRQLIDWPSELSSFSLGGQQSFLRCTYCSAPTGPAQPPAWGQANPSPTPGPNKPSYFHQVLTPPVPCGGTVYISPCTPTPPPSCSSLQDVGIVVGGAGTAMRAYTGLAALVPGLGLPATATVGGAGSIVGLAGWGLAAAGHFHIGCTP